MIETSTAHVNVTENESDLKTGVSDLDKPVWAVVDSQNCIVCGVTYREAVDLGISFLSDKHIIVTVSTALRLCCRDSCNLPRNSFPKNFIRKL